MKRILLLTVIGFTLLLFAAPGAWAFGVKDVIKMNNAGIPDSLIVLKIQNSGKTFHLDGEDIQKLHDAEVSDEVIAAMLRTEGRDRYDDYGYIDGAYYRPYSYYYPYSRFSLGFGYYGGYGGRYSHRYGGYYSPRYQPYSRSPYSGSGTTQRYRGSYGSRQSSGGSGQYHGGATAPSGGSTSGGSRPSGSGTRTRTR